MKGVIKLKESKYQTDICIKVATGSSEWICKNCHSSIMKIKYQCRVLKNPVKLARQIDYVLKQL